MATIAMELQDLGFNQMCGARGLRYKSYAMWRGGHFMFARTQESRLLRAKRLLNKVKNKQKHGMFFFLSLS